MLAKDSQDKNKQMKHPIFKCLGGNYPYALEERYDRVLTKIEQLWDTPEIDNYFSDLVIDRRGNRQGFPTEVLNDILRLRDFRESQTIRNGEDSDDALYELQQRGIDFNNQQFFHALRAGDQALIDLFVRANFNVNTKDEHYTPPILFALKKGYTVIAQILLKADADVNVIDRMGLTPLLIACGKSTIGYKTIAEMLIMKGAFINVRDKLGNTPLLLALSGGTADIAELLIQRGADISAQTREGETSLSLAEKSGNTHIVELLISKGATR